MDPLNAAASIITVLQAANTVLNICYDYRNALNGVGQWHHVASEVRSLRNLLEALSSLVAEEDISSSDLAKKRLASLKLLCEPADGPLASALEELNGLEKKLRPSWGGPVGSKRQTLKTALFWPLKKADSDRSLGSLERSKSMLALALNADQT